MRHRYPRAAASALLIVSVATTLATPVLADRPSIEVWQDVAAFDDAVRIQNTISFDDVASGTAIPNPAVFGSVQVEHSTASVFRALDTIAWVPVSTPNVLAPLNDDVSAAFGVTAISFDGGGPKAAGLFIILPAGSNSEAFWTTTVTATNAAGQSVDTVVTFQGQVGEQRFVGFTSHSPLRKLSFGVAAHSSGTTSALAIDDILVGK